MCSKYFHIQKVCTVFKHFFFIPYPAMDVHVHVLLNQKTFFFLNTFTKAGQMQFVNVKTFCFLCHCYITWQLFM